MVALFAAWRSHRLTPVLLSTAVALTLSLLYVFLLGYAALRFLLPIVALLSIPIALGLVALAQRHRRTTTAVAVAVVVAVVGANLGVQFATLHHHIKHDGPTRTMFRQTGLALTQVGLKTPCAVIGSIDPAPVAYWAHCLGGAQTIGPFAPAFVRQAKRYQRRGMQVAVVTYRTELPPYFANWTHRTALPGVHDHAVQVWVSPPPAHSG
jgi:hypothetical protein